MTLSESVRTEISGLISKHRVVLFMKGTRQAPQCGFSAEVVQTLDQLLPSYETVDVLRAGELREAIKEYSQWPTIPQLYIDGQFIGGSDIVRELSRSGELERLIGVEAKRTATPVITISDAAVRAFAAAMEEANGDCLRVQITPQYEHDLFLGPRAAGDIEVSANGVTLFLDPASARLADGIHLDFIDGPSRGFKITNPNQPAGVVALSVSEAKAMLDRGELTLFDVRPEAERELASIGVAHALDAPGREHLRELGREAPIAFHCHHGMRSRGVAEQAVREGFKKIYNLEGGIDAWSREIDESVPRY